MTSPVETPPTVTQVADQLIQASRDALGLLQSADALVTPEMQTLIKFATAMAKMNDNETTVEDWLGRLPGHLDVLKNEAEAARDLRARVAELEASATAKTVDAVAKEVTAQAPTPLKKASG